MCAEAKRLLNLYTAALDAYHRDWPPFSFESSSRDPRFEKLKAAKENARKAVFKAQQSYWDHLNQHGCGTPA